MERCTKCGRIPLYCNCDFDRIYATLPIKEPLTYEEIETKLRAKGIIGQASFIQSEKNSDGNVKTYWINYWIKQKNIPGLFESDGEKYETSLSAMNGILDVYNHNIYEPIPKWKSCQNCDCGEFPKSRCDCSCHN